MNINSPTLPRIYTETEVNIFISEAYHKGHSNGYEKGFLDGFVISGGGMLYSENNVSNNPD